MGVTDCCCCGMVAACIDNDDNDEFPNSFVSRNPSVGEFGNVKALSSSTRGLFYGLMRTAVQVRMETRIGSTTDK